MKKKLTRWSMRKLTVFFFLLLAMAVHARQVTPEEAAAIASEFLNSSSPQLATARRVGVKRAQARTDAGDNSPRPYYVFTGDENRGFVIISGDDRTKPILGYSRTNTFDFDNLPPGLEWMLGQYEKEIEALSASATETRAEYATSDTRGEIEPLLTTKWNQMEPYNNKCPVISGQHAMTGCVATAFAQVMNYHKWPERGRGSHSYDWNGDTYSIDFSQIAFDWDAMSDVYRYDSSERSKDAVATLMMACGYSVDMMYGIAASGANDGLIPNVAHEFFDYSSRASYANRADYTSEEWEVMIYHQLSKGLPVIYSGFDERSGHCFVCDGYDCEGYYHFNWGWGGFSDGYFLLSDNFNKGQACVLNFYPSNKESDYTPSFSDGTFMYEEIGQGNLALLGLADSDNKLGGDVVLPNEIVINGTRYAVTCMWCRFSDILDLENLTSLDIRIPVTSIPGWTFQNCSSLTSIELPSSVTSLGDCCFYDCSSLTSVEIPSSVTSLGDCCFWGCSSLTSIEIPSSVTSLGGHCFYDCSSLTSIEIPSSVTSLGNGSFWGCSSLTSVEIPSSVTSLGGNCFYDCSSLTSIEIPSSVTSLGESCFSWCSSLTSVEIPTSVTNLGDHCFAHCKSLTSIEIPSSVTSLGESCFNWCSSLTSIEIPSSVTSLGVGCFNRCYSLTSIELPSSVTSLGESCFYSCLNLTSVVSKIKEPFEFGSWCFDGIPYECTLTVPHGKRDAYMAAGWTEGIFRGGIVEAPYNPASENYLVLSDVATCKGCGVVLPVDMHNSEAITALQFELSLPTGVTLSDCLLTGRKGDHVVSHNRLANGNYQVIVFSMNNRTFPGSEGALLELSLDVDGGVPSGDHPVIVKNIELTTSDEQAINPDEVRTTLTVSDVKPADANGDGKISVTDVVAIVNYILGKSVEGFHFAAADVNGDGKISITDAVVVVDMILDGNVSSSAKERDASLWLDPQ